MTQQKPIFVATHPRACSTAFERVFMTCHDTLQCIHEPFGDAFYYGPERLSTRFESNERAREESGYSQSTYKTVLDRIYREGAESPDKRIFIKDITYNLFPPHSNPASIAPSLCHNKRGVGTGEGTNGLGNRQDNSNTRPSSSYPYDTPSEPGNPTVIPEQVLKKFHFAFLIRHPRRSIPSYYRCTVPPLDDVTGFYDYMPSEAGYDELRRMFDYLRSVGQVGPNVAYQSNPSVENGDKIAVKPDDDRVDICVVDADDLLDYPAEVVEKFCKSVGIEYRSSMLKWNEADQKSAIEAFEKWKGFHDDAIYSNELKPREHRRAPPTVDQENAEWSKKYGAEAAEVIRNTVEANIRDYEYLKQFAIKVGPA